MMKKFGTLAIVLCLIAMGAFALMLVPEKVEALPGAANAYFSGVYGNGTAWDNVRKESITVSALTTLSHLSGTFAVINSTANQVVYLDWYYMGEKAGHYVVGQSANDTIGVAHFIDFPYLIIWYRWYSNNTGFGLTLGNGQYELVETNYLYYPDGTSYTSHMNVFFNTTTPFATTAPPSAIISQIGGVTGILFMVLGPLMGVFLMRVDNFMSGLGCLILLPLIGLFMVYAFMLT